MNSIKNFLNSKKNIKILQNLINKLKISDYLIANPGGKFSNKKIMFTGGFRNMSRSEAKSTAEKLGAKVLGSVSKKLDILVVGDSKPTKKKVDIAKVLKVKIISEKEWNEILDN